MPTVISILKMPIWAFLGFVLACCFISGITGDVPDGVVYTDLHMNAQLGSRAVLICLFYGTPSAVYWKKGDNPSTAPNLIFWVEGEPEFGSCVKDKTCEMGEDYSLIIKNVSIADQGRYICRVSNYKGILLHNFTDVKVLAPPEEPYPIINECNKTHGRNCILLATNPVNITCTVLKYFPKVDLFFLHGIKKYSTADTLEWTNTDGTKSKSIFTTAPPSEIPYGCVAFNIPGSQEQRTATVTVTGQNDVTTTYCTPSSRLPLPSETDGPIERNKYFIIKIVVPIIAAFCVVTGIILFSTIYRRRQRRKENKNDDEAVPMVPRKKIDGNISYYELWRLFREIDDTALLRNTLRELRKADIKEDLSEQEAYEMLCTWKDNNRSGNEGKILNKALLKVLKKDDYDRARGFFCASKTDSSMKSFQDTLDMLEHILLSINDLKKMNKFLNELIPSRPTSVTNDSVDAMQSALKELTEWSNGKLDLNPLVLLSSALERAECRSVAKTFFKIQKLPAQLTSPIEPKAIEEIVLKLTGRHCKRLMAAVKTSDDDLGSIIAENNDFLFDTKTMISDWLSKLECSSDYEKRCRFDDAVIKIGRYDLLDCFGTVSSRPLVVLFKQQQNLLDHDTIYDDDIPQLVKLIKCLPPDKIAKFNKKTGFSADRDDSIVEEDLREKRDNILTRSTSRKALSQEFRSLRHELTTHTENFDSTVTDEEIEVVASQVTAADKQQGLLRCLGIEVGAKKNISFADHLKKWRETKENSRKVIQDSLRHIGFGECIVSKCTKKFVYQVEFSSIALNLLMEDVRPIIEALAIDRRTVSSYMQPLSQHNKGTKRLVLELLRSRETNRDDFCIKALQYIGFSVSRSVYFDYEPSLSELINILDCVGRGYINRFLKHLDLDADDIEECRDSKGQIDKLKLMRLWKRQIRPVPYYYRFEIATALRDAGLSRIAEGVLSGIIGDVPDGVVYTDLHKTVQLGDRVVLKCQFLGTPLAVYWKKGNDPTIKQSLMSWFGDEPLAGTCVKDKTCEMGDDFSLIIKNISITDQNRYICRVASYKGILIYNFTDVRVFALPDEPYPIINECKVGLRQKCTLPVTNPINITCTVLKYFPNVDLFFLHGNHKYRTIDTLEWTDTDGTKSKSVSTTAPPSEKPYVCVAFNIPGSQELQRTATVTVTSQNDVTTTPSSRSRFPLPSQSDGPTERKYSVIKIVVPIIIAAFCVVTGIILFFTIYWRGQRRRENKNDDEHGEAMPMVPKKKIDGKISYYELWRLFREIDDTVSLRNTLRELRKSDVKEDLSEQEGYEMLCTWKDNTRSGNEGKILNKALLKVLKKEDYDRARDFFCANKTDSSMKSYQDTLEHILRDINDLKKMNKFLNELIPGRPTSVINDSVKMVDAMQSALRELTEWSNWKLDLNPLVLLSYALERAECRSVAKTFFKIQKLPAQLTSPIEPKAIEEIVQKLTGRHCERLMAAANFSNADLGSIIAENNELLFDTKTMISDWLGKLECSTEYEKRCRFDNAVVKIGRYDLLDCFGTVSSRPLVALLKEYHNLFDHDTIYDDDIPQLVKLIKCLPPDKIEQFNKKTGLSAERDGSILEEALRERRDNILARSTSRDESSHEFRSLRRELTKHTENFESTVTDEEIEVVASQVTAAAKQEELLRCLGIEAGAHKNISFADHLKKWRKTKANSRKGIQDSLRHIGFGECIVSKCTQKFMYQVELSSIALNLLMEDVRPIIEALAIDRRTVSSYIQPVSKHNKGTKRLVLELLRRHGSSEINRDDFCIMALKCIGFDVSRSVYFDYEPSLSELINILDCVGKAYMDRFLKHLDLGPDEIKECRDSKGQIDKLKLLRLWKRQIRPVPFHYRLEIAKALRDAGLNRIAEGVLSGEYRRKGLNPHVLQDICSRLGDVGLTKLCSSLKLGLESTSRTLKASATLVTEWVNEWMSKYDLSDASVVSGEMRIRMRLNDGLYINGFCELAEEISALENNQQLIQ